MSVPPPTEASSTRHSNTSLAIKHVALASFRQELPITPFAVFDRLEFTARYHVRDGDAVVGEAELGVLDQVADDGGVVVRCHVHVLLPGTA
jgi:hypothetical protein